MLTISKCWTYPELNILRTSLDLLQDNGLKGGTVLPVAGGQHGLPQLVDHVVVWHSLLGNLLSNSIV